MFNGLVNSHDFVILARKIRAAGRRATITKLFGTRSSRVQQAWEHTDAAPVNWWNIPAVHERWNRLITGDPGMPYQTYVHRRYLTERTAVTGLSLGCGIGWKEVQWVRSCPNLQLTGTDLSAQRIAEASRTAESLGLGDRLRFACADIHSEDHPEASFDLIIADGSLHHFHSLDALLPKLRRWLKSDGLFVVNDYVGPARFQWSGPQLQAMNSILASMPEALRTEYGGHVKRKVYRPGRLSMIISDPSEAVESDRIDPSLHKHFRVIERTPYGGMLLQNILKGIAHHFLEPKGAAADVLHRLFAEEDRYLASGELPSDFCFYICKKGE